MYLHCESVLSHMHITHSVTNQQSQSHCTLHCARSFLVSFFLEVRWASNLAFKGLHTTLVSKLHQFALLTVHALTYFNAHPFILYNRCLPLQAATYSLEKLPPA